MAQALQPLSLRLRAGRSASAASEVEHHQAREEGHGKEGEEAEDDDGHGFLSACPEGQVAIVVIEG